MGDQRLNSVHLDPVRRESYRQAREALLQARGCDTVYAERNHQDSPVGNTFIHQQPGVVAPPLDYWLFDRDYIYPLKVGVNTLGRSNDNDVVVENLYVSRRHAAVLVHHDRHCVLHDTASKNGTFLNGARIDGPTPLKPGDEIRICNREFVFRIRDGSEASPASLTHTSAG